MVVNCAPPQLHSLSRGGRRVIGWACLCKAMLPNSVTPHIVHHSHHHNQRWVAGAATPSAYPGKRWAFPSVSRVYAGASLR